MRNYKYLNKTRLSEAKLIKGKICLSCQLYDLDSIRTCSLCDLSDSCSLHTKSNCKLLHRSLYIDKFVHNYNSAFIIISESLFDLLKITRSMYPNLGIYSIK